MGRDHSKFSIARANSNTRFAGKVVLFVEGRNTEPSYIALLKKTCCNVEPVTEKGRGIASCVEFVDKANMKFNNYSAQKRKEYKQKWVVFDYDGHDDFADAVKKARADGFKVAFSSMCIEYWFLLHFYDHDGKSIPMKGDSHSQAQIEQINRFIKSYNKKASVKIREYDSGSKYVEDDFFDLMMSINPNTKNPRIIDAYKRAKNIHLSKRKRGAEFSESVTTMYELMRELGVVKEKNGQCVLNK